MPDRITFDEAMEATSSQPQERITFDEAMDERMQSAVPSSSPWAPGSDRRVVVNGRTMEASRILPPDESHFGASLKANIIADPQTARREVAKSLFPDDPKGIERVGFVDGAPVYVDDKGQLRRVASRPANALSIATTSIPEVAGSIIGSFATGNPVTGSALGGAGGAALKRAASELLFDEPATPASVGTEMAGEFALNMATGGAGKAFAKFSDRGRVIDFTPADKAAAEAVQKRIKDELGIDLDLAQASGDAKLIALRNYARRYPGKSQELLQASEEAQQGQFEQATNRVLDLVAKAEPSEAAGARGVNAAQLAIKVARDKVYADVDPLYKAAYAAVPEVTDTEILKMLQLPGFPRALKVAKKMLELKTGEKFADDAPVSLQLLDQVKRSLDDQIGDMKSSGKREMAGALKERRDEFVAKLDALPNQQWQLARKRYGELIEAEVKPLEEGAVGVISKIERPELATAAAKILSDPNVTADQIRQARSRIAAQDADAWNGLVRQWLGQKFNTALKETQSGSVVNPAGKFRQAVFGTPADKEKAKAMLPGNAAQVFDDLMVAAEKLASTPVRGSDTASNQIITEQLKGKALAALSWIITPRQAARTAAEQRALDSGVESLTTALLNPQKRNQLRQVVKMAPSTRQAIIISSILGGQVGDMAYDISPREALPEQYRN